MTSVREDLSIGFGFEVGNEKKMWEEDGKLYCRFGSGPGEIFRMEVIYAGIGSETYPNKIGRYTKVGLDDDVIDGTQHYRIFSFEGADPRQTIFIGEESEIKRSREYPSQLWVDKLNRMQREEGLLG